MLMQHCSKMTKKKFLCCVLLWSAIRNFLTAFSIASTGWIPVSWVFRHSQSWNWKTGHACHYRNSSWDCDIHYGFKSICCLCFDTQLQSLSVSPSQQPSVSMERSFSCPVQKSIFLSRPLVLHSDAEGTPFGIRDWHTRFECTCIVKSSSSFSEDLNRWHVIASLCLRIHTTLTWEIQLPEP